MAQASLELLPVGGAEQTLRTRPRLYSVPTGEAVRPHTPRTWVNGKVREVIDRLLAGFGLVIALPVMALIILGVRLDSRGDAIFTQTRVGRNGKPFTIYKFRTMTSDAEARKAHLLAQNEAAGPLFKMRNDPRITRLGGYLRKSSLDELPQLVNVLRGEMSLVGPRPALPEEVDCYDGLERMRLEVKPGVTGLWQVSGRSELPAHEAVRLDNTYQDAWTVRDDVRVLFATIVAVVARRGAY